MWKAFCEFLQRDLFFTIGMLVLLTMGLVVRVTIGFFYRGLIREAENMATTGHRVLRQWKVKYENCFEMNKGVSNTAIFVDKLISRLAFGPFTYDQWYLVSAQLQLLSVLLAGVGIARAIGAGRPVAEILPYYIITFLGLYLFITVTTSVAVREQRRILKVNMIDYLENHLAPRIHVTKEDMEYLYGEQTDPDYELVKRDTRQKDKRVVEWKKKQEQPVRKGSDIVTYDELERLLKELLTT